MAKREKVLYAEKYKRGAAMIRECYLPNLPHVDGKKFTVHSGEVLEAGRVECGDGVKREFQTIRFLLSDVKPAERPPAKDPDDQT
jgi:hypothetical protein